MASIATGLEFLPADGEAARLIGAYDWASTPLGSPTTWSPSLRMVVRLMLASHSPSLLWWGPDYIQFYNDRYAPILGKKHPQEAMGKPFRECWHEVYDVLRGMVDTPFTGGPPSWLEDMELIVRRHGFPEESHFTGSYSPVPDDTAPNGIGGVLATVVESTEKVIAERRVKILSLLGARVAEATTDEDACRQAIEVIAKHPKDVPFALVYLADESAGALRLISSCGIDAASVGPAEFDLDALRDAPWPIQQALAAGSIQHVDQLANVLPVVPSGPWPDPPDRAAVVPLKSSRANRPAGALVAGISACIRFDERYASFIELVGSQVATAIANARAYEDERRRAEALAEIDRAKTAFFSNVSHEFRTPLTLMLGPLEDLLAIEQMPAPARAKLEITQRNALRLTKLVNSLLDFARIEAGRIDASYAATNLPALTADLASTFRSAMERSGLQFDVECDPIGEPVYVDRDMWEKIVLNLLSNAFKYTKQGGVRVRLRRDGAGARLDVTDTGIGIPEHEVGRIFDRFHRVEGSDARTHEGSGIGLALVQELTRLHGGAIEVASEFGRGTTFTAWVPLGVAHLPADRIKASPQLAPATVRSQAYVQEALRWLPSEEPAMIADAGAMGEPVRDERFRATFGSRVLVADDNADMRTYLRQLLEPLYRVEAVADGAAAFAAARHRTPDLIISDVMMPKVDGFALVAALRADSELREIPVIILSARAGEESRIDGLAAGADDYIVKPFHARELLARIGALIELTETRRQGEARFRTFVEATSDVVYRMAPDWKEMRYLQGRSFIADQADPSRNWLQKYIHPDDQPQVMAAIAGAVRERRVFELEHRVIRADGSLGWAFSRAVPLFNTAGEIVEWLGAATDITARREDQDAISRHRLQLEELDRQKNEFLAMLAHELRNPLAPIRNAGELLARTTPADAQARAALATVERQVTHLTRLVDDLLDVSRITQGRIELRRTEVRLDHVIANAIEPVQPLARQRNHRVVSVSAPAPLIVNADPERLVQCLGNILGNAAKYTPAGGEIRITASAADGNAVVSISDNGIGIPAQLLPKVFDLFVQGERTLDRSQGGLGVGLTICKRLVELQGGTITVTSNGAEQGATFVITLPLVEERSAAITGAMNGKGISRRILVVDDNQDGATMLAALLQHDGHQVITAFDGLEALEQIQAFKPEVALLDIGLPGIDGYEVARRIRAMNGNGHMHLIALTGYGRDEDRRRIKDAGFADHLIKPVGFADLQRVLARIS